MSETEPRALAAAIIASQFAPSFMFSGVTVALPAMGHELGAGATELGLVETVFLAGSLALILPAGRLADTGDKRSLYKLGLAMFAASSLLIAGLSWMPALLVVRALQGAASALFATTGPAILAEIVPPQRRGQAFGASIGATYAGLTLGPMAAGLIVQHLGWRAVFIVGGLVLVVGALAIQALMSSRWRSLRGALDPTSTTGWALVVVLGVAGSVLAREGWIAGGCLGASALVLVGFVLRERRVTRPLLDVNLLARHPALSRALAVQLLLYMNAFASIFLLSVFMQTTLGASPELAGRAVAMGSVMMAFVAPLSGVLADRIPPRIVSSVGVGCVVVTTFLARGLGPEATLLDVVVVLSTQSLGFALFSTPNMKTIMGSLPGPATGLASALGATSRSVGMVSGMLVAGVALSLALGHDPVAAHPEKFGEAMRSTYLVFSVVVVAAFLIALAPLPARTAAAHP